MPGRVLERTKRRLPCDIHFAGKQWGGMVLDVSASGLFVQTGAKVAPGDLLELSLSVPGIEEPVQLQVEVVRRKHVPAQLRNVAQGGLGVRVRSAAEAFYRFMQELGCAGQPSSRIANPSAHAGEPRRAYQVRGKQASGPRSKRVFVEALDEMAAEAAALEQLGDGWQILEVSEV